MNFITSPIIQFRASSGRSFTIACASPEDAREILDILEESRFVYRYRILYSPNDIYRGLPDYREPHGKMVNCSLYGADEMECGMFPGFGKHTRRRVWRVRFKYGFIPFLKKEVPPVDLECLPAWIRDRLNGGAVTLPNGKDIT